ncbi:FAD-dependent oxidoreductase [Fodinicola acaciae]|uniref:FAD-dependent oxidoreductase n=1 Tax=Fodinicola acaciae TaxID=2681555 RepID=UPI0013D23DB1|nr:FAD-dependent oxidoreductase [Fodinicola acaciae]
MAYQKDRPLRVAVIGAGPAGIYAADALTSSDLPVTVDVYDKLPAPYGLVRYGVAPDHPKIQSISEKLRLILERDEVRFFGNVAIGDDLTLDDVRRHYDAVLFSTGIPGHRDLGVPGDNLPSCQAAADFVSWYNGHPDALPARPLESERVAVIGAGNVALDVARMLVTHADDLASTDVPDDVLAALRTNKVTDVYVVGRRGPAYAKFTAPELRELPELDDVDLIVHPDDMVLDPASQELVDGNRKVRTNVNLFTEWSKKPLTGASRRLHLLFWRKLKDVTGTDDVTGVRFERTHPGSEHLGEIDAIEVQAVFAAIGYEGQPLPGLPFDPFSGTVPHETGRVVENGAVVPGLYVAGWVKRGPIGVIGNNKADAVETVRSLLADAESLPGAENPDPAAVDALLESRGVRFVTYDHWLRLEAHELAAGAAQGRTRSKVAERARMLSICHPDTQ